MQDEGRRKPALAGESHIRKIDASDRRRRAVVQSAVGFAIVVTDCNGIVSDWNTGAENILGWSASEMVGSDANRIFTPEDRVANRIDQEMTLAVRDGRASDERWHMRKDGSRFWASGELMPVIDAGEHIGFVKIVQDRTKQRRDREQLADIDERRRMAAEVGEVGLWDLDVRTGELTLDARMRALNGVDGDHIDAAEAFAAVHPDDRARLNTVMTRLVEGEDTVMSIQYRVVGIEDGVVRTIQVHGKAARDGSDNVVRIVGAARDISDRVAVDARRTVLNQELSHRLKNTLALVSSIVTQTLRTAPDMVSARKALTDRILALSKAHDVLMTGQRDAASIRTVVEVASALHDGNARISTKGPNIPLGPKAALTLSLIVHELSTNAGKHGALSIPEGRVVVEWSVDRDPGDARPRLNLEWREENGPPVTPPSRKSFGTRLIEMGLSGSTERQSELIYAPDGLRCRITASLTELMTEDEVGAGE